MPVVLHTDALLSRVAFVVGGSHEDTLTTTEWHSCLAVASKALGALLKTRATCTQDFRLTSMYPGDSKV